MSGVLISKNLAVHQNHRCPVPLVSPLHRPTGLVNGLICFLCGLPPSHGYHMFHTRAHELQNQSQTHSDGGFQALCEMFCWYYYWVSPSKIFGVNTRKPHSESMFRQWLSGDGYLGYPWSNSVTLFMQLLYPQTLQP